MTTTRSLNDYLIHLLAQANRQITRQLSAEGVSLDQWRLLKYLSEADGSTMGELATGLSLNLPTLTKIVDKMVTDAQLYRVPDPNDRRKVRIFISHIGRALLERQSESVSRHQSKFEDGNEDAERLRALLESLLKRIG
jgi:DNA-binding MarR family transcriptional regulator